MVIEVIPFGHENGIPLSEVCARSGLTSRMAREAIREANLSGERVINNGRGYFRYAGHADDAEYRRYRTSEIHRAREIIQKIRKMDGAKQ